MPKHPSFAQVSIMLQFNPKAQALMAKKKRARPKPPSVLTARDNAYLLCRLGFCLDKKGEGGNMHQTWPV